MRSSPAQGILPVHIAYEVTIPYSEITVPEASRQLSDPQDALRTLRLFKHIAEVVSLSGWFCSDCDRKVETKKRRSVGVWVTVILLGVCGLIAPPLTHAWVWGATLCIFLVTGTRVCSVCGRRLQNERAGHQEDGLG